MLYAVEEYREAYERVLAHPMCLRAVDEGDRVTVVYPEGDFSVGGVRVPRSKIGLDKALERMEEEWLSSYPGAR